MGRCKPYVKSCETIDPCLFSKFELQKSVVKKPPEKIDDDYKRFNGLLNPCA